MRVPTRTIIAAIAVVAATAAFGLVAEPRESIPAFLVLFFSSCTALAVAVWRDREALWNLSPKRALVLVLVAAALFRLAAFAAPVSLSDDIWRYVWDGQLVVAGENPYRAPPTELADRGGVEGDLFEKLNRPDAQTVYPPLSQAVFAAAVGLQEAFGGEAERWLRGLFSVFDVAGIAVLGIVLMRLKRSPMWAVLYAWHPLVFWEVAAGGHTEAVGVVWLAAVVGLAVGGRAWLTGVAIGLAGLAKWTFLAASPVVAFFLWRKKGLGAAAAATVGAMVVFAAGYGPFVFDRLVANHLESLRLYAEDFSFNAPVYYGFRYLIGYREGITEPVHHITRPVLTALTVAAIAWVSFWQDGSVRRLVGGMTLCFGAYVVFSPVFHPWYALPLLAVAALAGWTAPAVAGAVIAASYAFYAPWMTDAGQAAVMALQVVVVTGWVLWEFGSGWMESILERRARWKADEIDEHLSGDQRVLDLGCGEGYVGRQLAERGHRVQLADVVDNNRTELPLEVYDGRELPFEDDAFEAVVLSYVLHHADDPEAVIAEALRVGRRVIALETVYESGWDRRLTTVLDLGANALRGIRPQPLNLDTVHGWIERFEAQRATVAHWHWLGRGLHRHVVLVCDR